MPVHTHKRTYAHGLLACFSRQKATVLCAPCSYSRYSRYVDQALSVLYVCRLGTENYDTVSQCCTRSIRLAPSPSLLAVCAWVGDLRVGRGVVHS